MLFFPCARCGYEKDAPEDPCRGKCERDGMNGYCWECNKDIAYILDY